MSERNPWDEQWRIDAAKGVIMPGSVVRAGDGWTVCPNAKPCGAEGIDDDATFEGKTFMVMSRTPEFDRSGRRTGWDDVLLLEVTTGRVGWWMLDPGNPESIVLVR